MSIPSTTGAPTPQSANGGEEALLTIGQVVALLQPEFPDLSISKVRYLEDRGLLAPQRTPGGYRKYASSDVRRLRTVLIWQRDDFLPLGEIRRRLQEGGGPHLSRSLANGTAFEQTQGIRRKEETFSWPQAAAEAGVAPAFLKQLAEFRLVGTGPGPIEELTETDVEIARICGELARYGVEPRNLRLLRSSAEREVAMLEHLLAPSLRSTRRERREEGERLLIELGGMVSRLLDLLLYKELQGLLE